MLCYSAVPGSRLVDRNTLTDINGRMAQRMSELSHRKTVGMLKKQQQQQQPHKTEVSEVHTK